MAGPYVSEQRWRAAKPSAVLSQDFCSVACLGPPSATALRSHITHMAYVRVEHWYREAVNRETAHTVQ